MTDPTTPGTFGRDSSGLDLHGAIQHVESILGWLKDHLIQQQQPGGDPSDPGNLAAERANVVADYAKRGAAPTGAEDRIPPQIAASAGGMSPDVLARAASRTPTNYQQGNPGGAQAAPSGQQTYEITAPNGQKLQITGDHVPNEAELKQIFAKAGVDTVAKKPQPTDVRLSIGDEIKAAGAAEQERTSANQKSLVNALPAIGAGVGGMVGGGIPGATLGGAAGEAFKQLINRATDQPAPATATDAAQGIATQGAVFGTAQAAGSALAAGASPAGKWLMNRALNVTDKLAREFPELSQTAIDNAVTVTKAGLNKARALLAQAKQVANQSLGQTEAAGVTVSLPQAVDAAIAKVKADVMNSADVQGGLRALDKLRSSILSGRSADLAPTAADALKSSLQRDSKALYTALKMGTGRPATNALAQGKAAIATELNAALEAATTQAGFPGYQAANGQAQEFIGAMRGVSRAIRPGANLYQAMVRPGVGMLLGADAGHYEGHPYLGMVVGAALTSPRGMSRLAVLLSSPAGQQLIRQSPGAVIAFLREATTAGLLPGQTPPSGPPRQ